jgi:hypothetical protein
MKLKIFFSFILLLFLSNCAGTGTKNLSQLSFQNKPGESSIFFVRPERFVAGGVRIGVFVDGQEIGKLGVGEMEKFPVKPGGHSINIKSGDLGGFGISSDAYSIIAEPNKNYFFIIDLDQGFFSSSWKITETSEQGFRKALN